MFRFELAPSIQYNVGIIQTGDADFLTNYADNLSVPNITPTVSMQVVQILLRYAKEKDIDLEGIPLKVFLADDGTEARLPAEDFNYLWSEVARRSGNPNFGLHFGEASFSYPAGNILLAVLMNCRTLEDALHKLCRYHGLTTDYVLLQLQKDSARSYLAWNPVAGQDIMDRHHIEAVMTNLRRLIHGLSGGNVAPVGIDFRHPQPLDTTMHQKIFGCPLRFEQDANRLYLKTEDLSHEIFLANPALLQELERIARDMLDQVYTPDTWSKRVSKALSALLVKGEDVDLAFVANELAISPRGLQAKLQEEGKNYREIFEDLRKEMALRYLARKDISLYEVAFLLGYSEQSAFNRAFKRWTGLQPRQYQLQSQADLG